MPSTAQKILQRLQGLVWGDGVKDSAAYFDGHTLVVDLVGRDTTKGLLVRGLGSNNAPADLFWVNKDGSAASSDVGVGASSPSFNWLYNPSFDIWDDFGGLPGFVVGWGLTGAGATAARDTTNVKISPHLWQEFSSAIAISVTRAGADARLDQGIQAIPEFGPAARWGGKRVTFGCWVRATVATRARLSINDGTTRTYSDYHTGGGAYEFLTVTVVLPTTPTVVEAACHVDNGNTAAQFDGAVFCEGAKADDFTPMGYSGRSGTFLVSSNTGGNPSAGGTHYLYTSGHLTAEAGFRCPYKGNLKNIRAKSSAAPGAGQSYTYTLRLNNADTTVATSIAGAAATSGDNVTSLVECQAGDEISIKLVTSGSAAGNFHTVSFEIVERP